MELVGGQRGLNGQVWKLHCPVCASCFQMRIKRETVAGKTKTLIARLWMPRCVLPREGTWRRPHSYGPFLDSSNLA